jgi:ABC-type transporter Mla subunit MlaD
MKTKKWINEFQVGLFVFLCLAGFFYMSYRTGKMDIKKKGYEITVVFPDAAGLHKKAPVMLNGLEIGKVDDVTPTYLNNKTTIALKLWLEENAKVREGSKFSIQMMGLMGEKYVQIASSENEKFIEPGSTTEGEPYVDLSVLIVNLNKLVEDNKSGLGNTIKNFDATSENFLEFSDDLKRNPWKLLFKTKEKPRVSDNKSKAEPKK